MARLNIIICDLCKGISKVTLQYILTLQSGKGKDKEVTKAEICPTCHEDLIGRVKSEFEFNNSFSSKPRREHRTTPSQDVIEIVEGESIVASNVDNIAPPPQPRCLHDRKSFIEDKEDYLRCRDCGEEWKA